VHPPAAVNSSALVRPARFLGPNLATDSCVRAVCASAVGLGLLKDQKLVEGATVGRWGAEGREGWLEESAVSSSNDNTSSVHLPHITRPTHTQ
jgi:hypothetical protein